MKSTITLLLICFLILGCKKSNEILPPPSVPDTTSHAILWQTDSLGYYSSRLLDIWGTSPSNVYAVGLLMSGGPQLSSYITHFDGSGWTTLQYDSLDWWLAGGLLAGIYGVSDTMIFVVGCRDNGGGATGFVGRWNGRYWTNISPDSCDCLLTIWARSPVDVYAGGAGGVILHFNGNQWHTLNSGTPLDVWQINGIPSGEVYAVACNNFNSFAGSPVLQLAGDAVTQEYFFPVGCVLGVHAFSTSNIMVVGDFVDHMSDGGQWQSVSTPCPSVTLYSIAATGANNILIAGAYGAVIHWSGLSWKFYDGLYDRSSSKSYFKVLAIGDRYFLVGNTPYHAMITMGTRTDL